MNLVRISTSAPSWFPLPLRPFPKLYPGWNLVEHYKKGEDSDEEARASYYDKVLRQLDPQAIWQELGEDAVLLCWEKPGDFCHRRLVAEWLEKRLGVTIKELELAKLL